LSAGFTGPFYGFGVDMLLEVPDSMTMSFGNLCNVVGEVSRLQHLHACFTPWVVSVRVESVIVLLAVDLVLRLSIKVRISCRCHACFTVLVNPVLVHLFLSNLFVFTFIFYDLGIRAEAFRVRPLANKTESMLRGGTFAVNMITSTVFNPRFTAMVALFGIRIFVFLSVGLTTLLLIFRVVFKCLLVVRVTHGNFANQADFLATL
jgi:hypothetical protein